MLQCGSHVFCDHDLEVTSQTRRNSLWVFFSSGQFLWACLRPLGVWCFPRCPRRPVELVNAAPDPSRVRRPQMLTRSLSIFMLISGLRHPCNNSWRNKIGIPVTPGNKGCLKQKGAQGQRRTMHTIGLCTVGVGCLCGLCGKPIPIQMFQCICTQYTVGAGCPYRQQVLRKPRRFCSAFAIVVLQ